MRSALDGAEEVGKRTGASERSAPVTAVARASREMATCLQPRSAKDQADQVLS